MSLGASFLAACRVLSPSVTEQTDYAIPVPIVRVELVDLTVSPWRSNGRPWDGPILPGTELDTDALAGALASDDSYAAVVGLLREQRYASVTKPDVSGRAALVIGGEPREPRKFESGADTLTQRLRPTPTWLHVRVDDTASIAVDVFENDAFGEEPVGNVVIPPAALKAAAGSPEIYQVQVAKHTTDTILFAGIRAAAE